MEKNKKIILGIIIVISIIILLSVTICILNFKKGEETENRVNTEQEYIVRGENTKIEEKESSIIAKNDFNIFSIKGVREEDLLNQFLQAYLYEALNHVEEAFSLLNEEYRNAKFGNVSEYAEYVNNKREEMRNAELKKYASNDREEYKEYICVDQYNNYYIFYVKENMEYSVILDTYTIDLPEFLEKYNKAEDEQKVGYNIEKFVSAINEEDYKYAYNVLDESFKQKNMPTQADFEKFVKDNFYANNTVEHNDVEKQGNLFVYTITLKNANNESEQKELTVIMKLEEETDFVMSFSIN